MFYVDTAGIMEGTMFFLQRPHKSAMRISVVKSSKLDTNRLKSYINSFAERTLTFSNRLKPFFKLITPKKQAQKIP